MSSKDRSRSARVPRGSANGDLGAKLLQWLDIAVKLVPAAAVVVAAFVANNFQSSISTANLLNQREQADSALRAAMFHDLIGPIVGPGRDNTIPINQERLLVELLAFNFHEHFELKPMLVHVDERLARDKTVERNHHERQLARESLRSVARRVLQRQFAMLTKTERRAGKAGLRISHSPEAVERPENRRRLFPGKRAQQETGRTPAAVLLA